ncbi:hypothetical protein EDB19DRAFT_1832805 [Suillus lakei]|nr:hypothetical protein EDB19DRAFT_1832805 [Suillus lakei]
MWASNIISWMWTFIVRHMVSKTRSQDHDFLDIGLKAIKVADVPLEDTKMNFYNGTVNDIVCMGRFHELAIMNLYHLTVILMASEFKTALKLLSIKEIIAATKNIQLPWSQKQKRNLLLDTVRGSEKAHPLIIAAGKKKTMDTINHDIPSNVLPNLDHTLKQLTVKEILAAGGPGKFSRVEKQKRSTLITAILRSSDLQKSMISVATMKEKQMEEDTTKVLRRVCLQEEQEVVKDAEFLETVDSSIQEQCLMNFIDRTGNAGTQQVICVACAGEFFAFETTKHALGNIRHKAVL